MTDFWVGVSNFSERGITPRIFTEGIPLQDQELQLVVNYYSIILNYAHKESIIGPLPVAYHPELQVLIYNFEIIDHSVKDERIVRLGGKTPALLTVFYKIQCDEDFLNLRKKLLAIIANWIKKFQKIGDIKKKSIKQLKLGIEKLLSLDIETKKLGTLEEHILFVRQIEFLSNFVESYTIQILSDSEAYLQNLKEILLSQGHQSIAKFQANNKDNGFEVVISDVRILANLSANYKLESKNKSFIYFAENLGNKTQAKTIETFSKLVENIGPDGLCLLCSYNTDRKIDFQNSPLFSIASKAVGRNLSIVELKGEGSIEFLTLFMYQLIDKLQQ